MADLFIHTLHPSFFLSFNPTIPGAFFSRFPISYFQMFLSSLSLFIFLRSHLTFCLRKKQVIRPNPVVLLSSLCSYYPSPPVTQHLISLPTFPQPPPCHVSFLPSRCHVLSSGHFLRSHLCSSRGMETLTLTVLEGDLTPPFSLPPLTFLIYLNAIITKGLSCHPIIHLINQLSFLLKECYSHPSLSFHHPT